MMMMMRQGVNCACEIILGTLHVGLSLYFCCCLKFYILYFIKLYVDEKNLALDFCIFLVDFLNCVIFKTMLNNYAFHQMNHYFEMLYHCGLKLDIKYVSKICFENSQIPEELTLDYAEITSIPPLPLWTLLAADKENISQQQKEEVKVVKLFFKKLFTIKKKYLGLQRII